MELPALDGKTALVTGANTGIGRVTAIRLALAGAHVFLACRSASRTQPVLDEIARLSGGRAQATWVPLDLGRFDAIHACATQVQASGRPLHLLVNNAGLAGKRGRTESGFELAFGICHVGHFLLTSLLLPQLQAAPAARIVVLASRAHRHAAGIDFDAVQRPSASLGGLRDYSVAKLANILFSAELARRLQGSAIHSYALHPGVVATEVWRELPSPLARLFKPFILTPDQGAATTLYCATAPACAAESGLYYVNCRHQLPSKVAQSATLASELWAHSERWTGQRWPTQA
ncbi:MAG: SDR family NAD(P)-dependent oxidoreductase [Rhodoferax sp.]